MAAVAAVGSSLSTFLKCLRSKTWSSDPLPRIAPTRVSLQVGLVSQINATVAFPASPKWRVPRISADVAQEEAAAAVEEAEEVGGGEAEAGQEATNNPISTKLYFGNLPYLCDSAQLAGIIQQYASPELVEVLYDRDTGRSRGFAFVTMSTIEDCNAVIQNLDGHEYGGRTLRVNFSDKPRPKEPLYPETEYKLFVGNLSWSVTSESLAQAFQQHGNVVGARVLYDGETGRSRGYGFVSYSTKPEMETALESLNGVMLEGRAMRVSLAQGKRQ
ncbi:28 kDa ribonucleoprotein, chloroplastic-like [Actinidia eriantha]|uniref:28 kDa ribonucleoprotein, chloroplastic-like n=1 Tax=Actinidia eriantha TaxID=165200 RepID=UPI00258B9602|nr:28 kDa ribonucleoprotein, chloroplastic-like [Actinidia eriantha]